MNSVIKYKTSGITLIENSFLSDDLNDNKSTDDILVDDSLLDNNQICKKLFDTEKSVQVHTFSSSSSDDDEKLENFFEKLNIDDPTKSKQTTISKSRKDDSFIVNTSSDEESDICTLSYPEILKFKTGTELIPDILSTPIIKTKGDTRPISLKTLGIRKNISDALNPNISGPKSYNPKSYTTNKNAYTLITPKSSNVGLSSYKNTTKYDQSLSLQSSYEQFLKSLSDKKVEMFGLRFGKSNEPIMEDLINLANRCVKQFKRYRLELTHKLFEIYNACIFQGKFPKDFVIEWNGRLTKTAGKCFSRKRTVRNENNNEVLYQTLDVWIELSDKICDSPERVRDVLIHEMCHAAVFYITKSKNVRNKSTFYNVNRLQLTQSVNNINGNEKYEKLIFKTPTAPKICLTINNKDCSFSESLESSDSEKEKTNEIKITSYTTKKVEKASKTIQNSLNQSWATLTPSRGRLRKMFDNQGYYTSSKMERHHGPLWQYFAKRALETFPCLPPIKRCHTYDIKTKFLFKCDACYYKIGRHSKSIDVANALCPTCLMGHFEIWVWRKKIQDYEKITPNSNQ